MRRSLWLTGSSALIATGLVFACGVPLAYLLARRHFPGAGQRLERAERQRVQDHAQGSNRIEQARRHLLDAVAAPAVVGGIVVEEERFASGLADALLNFGDVSGARPAGLIFCDWTSASSARLPRCLPYSAIGK